MGRIETSSTALAIFKDISNLYLQDPYEIQIQLSSAGKIQEYTHDPDRLSNVSEVDYYGIVDPQTVKQTKFEIPPKINQNCIDHNYSNCLLFINNGRTLNWYILRPGVRL